MKIVKKYSIKIILIMLVSVLLISSFYTVKASSENPVKNWTGNIASDAKDGENILVKVVATVLNVIRIVGIAIAVIMLMTVACKYIIASSGDRADIKKYAVNYIIGALVLFGASTIVTIVKNFVVDSTGALEDDI